MYVYVISYSPHTDTTMLDIIANSIIKLNGLIVTLHGKFDQFREKVENDLQMLRDSMESQNHTISYLSTSLQEHKKQTAIELANISICLHEHKRLTESEIISLKTSLNSTQASFDNHTLAISYKLDILNSTLNIHDTIMSKYLQEHKQLTQPELCKVESSIDKLHTFLNDSVNNLTMFLQEHEQQTTTELSHLQTSLNSTHSKLDTLTNTVAFDRQKIVDNMTNVKCMDTQQNIQLHQNLQNNITHQLKTIKDNVESPPMYTCGGTGRWRRVVYLKITDPHINCPCGWQLTGYSRRTCGRVRTGHRICDSATFPVNGGEYSRVCGRIRAYQYGAPDGFWAYHHGYVTTIDGPYVNGVSITHGAPRNHIWTFANGITEGNPTSTNACPCDASITVRVPPFVGNDYFCESGINGVWDGQYILRSNDILWDGEDCIPSSTCCSLHNPPYFVKQLPKTTTDDIEARIFVHNTSSTDNIAVELVELYVQ